MRFLPLIALLAAAGLGAEEAPPLLMKSPIGLPSPGTVLSLVEENDKFAPGNKDRYYTQGLRLSFNTDEHHYWALTQEINTPADTNNPVPSDDDLPYSGALYLTYGYGTILDRGGRQDCLFTAELQFGVIGPASGAATVQNKFHDLVGITHPAGWSTQLPNEPAMTIACLPFDSRPSTSANDNIFASPRSCRAKASRTSAFVSGTSLAFLPMTMRSTPAGIFAGA